MPSPDATRNLIDRVNFEKYGSDPSTRWVFVDPMVKRPLIASDLDPGTVNQAAVRLLSAANLNLMAAGTNMTSALSTFGSAGGVTLTTAGANNDQALLVPASVNSGGTFITEIGGSTGTSTPTSPWLTNKSLKFEAIINLSSVANVRLVAGFKLTNTPTLATDDDQVYIGFDTGSSVTATRFRRVHSVAGTDFDVAESTGGFTVAAATDYRLSIDLDANRVPTFFINGRQIGIGSALTNSCGLMPVIGLQALTGAAKAMTIKRVRLERAL